MRAEPFNSLIRYAPLWAHLSVYTATCLIAAGFFYFDVKPVAAFVEYFSGSLIPREYTAQEALTLWMLLIVAPALFGVGFVVATRVSLKSLGRLLRQFGEADDRELPAWVPVLLFVVVSSIAAYDLARGGAFAKISAWGDYGAWVEGRWALFSTLGYFSFVNLYLFLPVSAAWVLISNRGGGWKILASNLIIFTTVVALTFFLFQKKALIVSLIIMIGTVMLRRLLGGDSVLRPLRIVIASGFLAVVYFGLVVLPIYSETSRTAGEVLVQKEDRVNDRHQPCEKPGTSDDIRKLCREVVSAIGANRHSHIVAYALLAPMSRTSLPAMYYPIVFPKLHDYYGLDLGQDILGFGGMPNDNQIIWKYMYPNLPGGSAGAPYQFALYSQVGAIWTLPLCALVGALLGGGWQVVLMGGIPTAVRSLTGTILVLFSIYLAIDSLRGSLLASYGLVWAWLFILFFFFTGLLFKRTDALGTAR
jgi:hypothetical protein